MDSKNQDIKDLKFPPTLQKVAQPLQKFTKIFGWPGWFGLILFFVGFYALVWPDGDQYSESKEYRLNGLSLSGPMKKSLDEIDAKVAGYKSLRDKQIKESMWVFAIGAISFLIGFVDKLVDQKNKQQQTE